MPIRIPLASQLAECQQIFDKAIAIQKDFFAGKVSSDKRDVKLAKVQQAVDNFACGVFGVE